MDGQPDRWVGNIWSGKSYKIIKRSWNMIEGYGSMVMESQKIIEGHGKS